MSHFSIRVCSNVETLADQEFMEDFGSGPDWREECVSEVLGDFFDWLAGLPMEVIDATEADSNFHRWHGGRYCQFWNRRGFVAINTDSPSAIELCDELDNKLREILNARIEKFDQDHCVRSEY